MMPLRVTSREGRVSRNPDERVQGRLEEVTSREGRVSRNLRMEYSLSVQKVTSREGRVSRNAAIRGFLAGIPCHVPRGACE